MMSWVIFVTVDFVTVNLSMLPFAMPGMLKPGVLESVYSRVGLTMSIVYGPMPGIVFEALNGDFAAGVGAALARPMANRNLPSGSESLTTISPVASSAVMPLMSASSFLASMYSGTPAIVDVNDENGPPRKFRRLIVFSKSEALTALPSEYFRPERSLKVYVILSAETVGIASARPGMRSAPAAPGSCLYVTRPV